MPLYVYQCKECGHRFESVATVKEHERAKTKPTCPKCKSANVEQRPATFHAITAGKA